MITTFSGARPERYLRRGEVLARPVPAVVVGQANVALLGQERQQVVRSARRSNRSPLSNGSSNVAART